MVCFDEGGEFIHYYDYTGVFVPFCEFVEEFNPVFDGEFGEAFVLEVAAHLLL